MSKLKILLAATLLTSTMYSMAAAESAVSVYYEGEQLNFEVSPYIYSGTTMVPFRTIFEKLGLEVSWDEKTKKVTGTSGEIKIELQIGNKAATVSGARNNLAVAPKIVDGSTFVPLRFISEASGKRVSWNPITDRVDIKKGMEVGKVETQYGGEPLIDINEYNSNINQKISPYIFEKDNKVYVMYTRPAVNDSETTEVLYTSVAEDGKWIVRDRMSYRIKKDENNYKIKKFFLGDALYIRNSEDIKRVTVDQYGSGTEEILFTQSATQNIPEIFYPVYTDQSDSFLYGTKGGMRIYSAKQTSYNREVKDVFNLIPSIANGSNTLVYSWGDMLSIYNGTSARQLNVTTGDMIYGDDGKDKVTKFLGKGSSAFIPFYEKGKMSFLYQDGANKNYKYGYMDNNLITTADDPTNFTPDSSRPKYQVTTNDTSINLWWVSEYQRRQVLNHVSILKNN